MLFPKNSLQSFNVRMKNIKLFSNKYIFYAPLSIHDPYGASSHILDKVSHLALLILQSLHNIFYIRKKVEMTISWNKIFFGLLL